MSDNLECGAERTMRENLCMALDELDESEAAILSSMG